MDKRCNNEYRLYYVVSIGNIRNVNILVHDYYNIYFIIIVIIIIKKHLCFCVSKLSWKRVFFWKTLFQILLLIFKYKNRHGYEFCFVLQFKIYEIMNIRVQRIDFLAKIIMTSWKTEAFYFSLYNYKKKCVHRREIK